MRNLQAAKLSTRNKIGLSALLIFIAAFIFAAQAGAMEIPLQKHGGVYTLPVRINGVITLDFILDSGASEVAIPADVFLTLLRTGTIKDEDILPGERYRLADGSTVKSPRFNIRDLEIAGYKITNVVGSIADPRGPLLLGQSFLDKLDSWTLDNRAHILIIGGHKTEPIKTTETENFKASGSELEEISVAQATPTSRSVIPPIPDLPSKYGMLLKEMLDGAKNADSEKIDHSKAELQVLSRGQKFHNKKAREKNAAGLEAVSKEQYDDALKHFYDAYLHCPQDVEILNNLGLALIKTGDFDNSEKALLRALSLAPTRTNAWALLGQVLSIKGDVSGGCACFLNAFRYTSSEKKTTEALQNLAEYDPFPNTQQAARLALSKLGKIPPPSKPIVTITDSVQAYYLENVHSGQILVIRGEVLNESSQPVISVMVQGKLYKKDNTIAQIQQCYVRNSLTDKEIENLTVSEISEKVNRKGLTLDLSSLPDQTTKNQGQIPNSTVELVPVVHPAEKAPFMLVFHNLPEIGTLNNYSVNVISAKFDKELPSTTPPGNTTSHAMAPKSETSDFFDIPGIPGLKWGDSPAEARDVMDRCNARIINAYEDYNKRAEAHGKSGMGFHGKFMERDGEATLIFYEHKLYKCSIVFDVSESESAESFYSHLFRILEVKFGLPDKTEINNDRRYVQWYGDVINLYFYQSFFRDSLSNHKHVDIIEFSDWKTEKIADEREQLYKNANKE